MFSSSRAYATFIWYSICTRTNALYTRWRRSCNTSMAQCSLKFFVYSLFTKISTVSGVKVILGGTKKVSGYTSSRTRTRTQQTLTPQLFVRLLFLPELRISRNHFFFEVTLLSLTVTLPRMTRNLRPRDISNHTSITTRCQLKNVKKNVTIGVYKTIIKEENQHWIRYKIRYKFVIIIITFLHSIPEIIMNIFHVILSHENYKLLSNKYKDINLKNITFSCLTWKIQYFSLKSFYTSDRVYYENLIFVISLLGNRYNESLLKMIEFCFI